MNRKDRRNTQSCCTTSFGGERIYRRLQEGSSAVVRCFCGLNWHLFRSIPMVCWVTKDSKPDASLEGLSNDWVSVIPVSDIWYPMCIWVLALLLKYTPCHRINVSKAAISFVPQQPELANYKILESYHKKKYIVEWRAKKMWKCTVETRRFSKVRFFSTTALVNNDTKLHIGQYIYLSIDIDFVWFLHIFLHTIFLDGNFRNILIHFLNTLYLWN